MDNTDNPDRYRLCPVCKGSGLDKRLHQRYTSGGHDEIPCGRCYGEGYLEEVGDEEDHFDRSPPE